MCASLHFVSVLSIQVIFMINLYYVSKEYYIYDSCDNGKYQTVGTENFSMYIMWRQRSRVFRFRVCLIYKHTLGILLWNYIN